MTSRWLTDPVECGQRAGFGIYLHIPFCAHRCGYCDFATYDDRGHLVSRYVAALRQNVARWAEAGPRPWGGRPEAGAWGRWPRVTSVFIGGGTPTLLSAKDLTGLLAVVRERFVLAADAEITIEANPESVEVEALASLVSAGVNRVSIGAQSFVPHVLATLERRHDPERPLLAVEAARAAGVANVNMDLIYGSPGETDSDWERTVETVVAAGTDHVSAYALTVAANTPLAHRVAAGAVPPPDGDVQRRRFELIRDMLASAGFDHYEVSNWAQSPARRCRHNLLYWRHGDYLGIGVGAHGHHRGRRWWSHRSIERYCAGVEANADVVSGEESLSIAERAEERLLLGLRVVDGLHPLDLPPLRDEAVEDVLRAGLARLSRGRLQATDDGWFLLDETLSRLLV
ncbi:MAG: radical SAM family heme chaperone HemW [Actinomycetota bacterium]|nr:radical SAM family heme chaperone HemW [Actinomycetota bacterium]